MLGPAGKVVHFVGVLREIEKLLDRAMMVRIDQLLRPTVGFRPLDPGVPEGDVPSALGATAGDVRGEQPASASMLGVRTYESP